MSVCGAESDAALQTFSLMEQPSVKYEKTALPTSCPLSVLKVPTLFRFTVLTWEVAILASC